MKTLRRVFHLGVKELISFRYDPVLFLFVIYAFSIDIVTAVDQAIHVQNAAIAIVDEDRSPLSARIESAFFAPEFQTPVQIAPQDVNAALNSGRFTFVIDIPPGFQSDILTSKQPEIQVNIDATAVAQAFSGSIYIQKIIEGEVARYLGPQGESPPLPVGTVTRIKYNQNMESKWFLSVAELLLMVTILTMMLPAAALIREQEHGTIGHLLVMPLRSVEIMLAKVWANALVVQLGCILCIYFVIRGYLNVPLAGSIPLFLFGTLIYQFTATAIGMVLATIVRTVPQYVLLSLLVIAPMIFLSGVFTPAESIPPALTQMMALSPLHYYVDFSMAVLFRDADLAGVMPELLIMAALGAGLFMLALLRFRAHFSMVGK